MSQTSYELLYEALTKIEGVAFMLPEASPMITDKNERGALSDLAKRVGRRFDFLGDLFEMLPGGFLAPPPPISPSGGDTE